MWQTSWYTIYCMLIDTWTTVSFCMKCKVCALQLLLLSGMAKKYYNIWYRWIDIFIVYLCRFPRRYLCIKVDGWGIVILKKDVYLTFCLWLFETSNTLSSSQNKATVDVYGICLYPWVYFEIKVYVDCYTYQRGLLRCSFRLLRAVRRPQTAGRVTGTDSRAFSFIVLLI